MKSLSSNSCPFIFLLLFILVSNSFNHEIFLLLMMPFFQPELGWSVWGSLGWTKTADGLNWRMLDCFGAGVGSLQCWSTGSGCSTLLQEELEGRRVGEGFARGRSDA